MPRGNTSLTSTHLQAWKAGDALSNTAKHNAAYNVIAQNLPINQGDGILVSRNGQGTTISLAQTPKTLYGRMVKVLVGVPLSFFNADDIGLGSGSGSTDSVPIQAFNGNTLEQPWTSASPYDIPLGQSCVIINLAGSCIPNTVISGFVNGTAPDGRIYVIACVDQIVHLQITGSVQDGVNYRWLYSSTEVVKDNIGYSGWTTVDGGVVTYTSAGSGSGPLHPVLYNLTEDLNSSSGTFGNGAVSSELGSLTLQPIPGGNIVTARSVIVNTGQLEYWCEYANAVGGSC